MSLRPDIPYLISKMKIKLGEALAKNPTANYDFQKQLIKAFESVEEDYTHYTKEHLVMCKRNANLHVKNTGLTIELAIVNSLNKKLEAENEQLKANIK